MNLAYELSKAKILPDTIRARSSKSDQIDDEQPYSVLRDECADILDHIGLGHDSNPHQELISRLNNLTRQDLSLLFTLKNKIKNRLGLH